MANAARLVVGLGNPGEEYKDTRHNIGFAVADALAAKARTSFDETEAQSLLGWGSVRGRRFGVAKPFTYMNRSGEAVRGLARRYGLDPSEILVVVDDIALPPGAVRLRPHGGDGGHNGLEDIISRLGSDRFPRLRIGIGDDFRRGHQADYVLSPFSAEEEPLISEAIVQARDAAVAFITDGVETAMNRYNRR